jgi:Trypsin-like serine proteases, typically periplasmic, contain C-terminal PDZ domain
MSLDQNNETEKGLVKTFPAEKRYYRKKRRALLRKIAGGVLFVTLAFVAGFSGAYLYERIFPHTYVDIPVLYQSVERMTSTSNKLSDELSIPEVVALVENSVVEIQTESSSAYRGSYVQEGAGSGVIITEDGYIATNNHVIDGASKISVTLKNGETYEAKVIGADNMSDIAVLKIDRKELSPVVFGDSEKLIVGQTAIAIGNPLGSLGGTVTNGIISSLSRELTIDGIDMTLLQTNSAVNPGNSGGGLFNGYGELIGIVNAKSMGEDIEGLGFAIPINFAKTIIEELISHGTIKGRVKLGLSLIDIDSEAGAMEYGVEDFGVYIYSIEKNSAADKAGLKEKDLIMDVNKIKVETSDEVKKEIGKHKVGDKVTITVLRKNERITVTATLQEAK